MPQQVCQIMHKFNARPRLVLNTTEYKTNDQSGYSELGQWFYSVYGLEFMDE